MAAHLYWRLNITANAGDTSFLAIAEIEMRATVGGADQCAGGTAAASLADPGAPVTNAFDNDAATRWSTTSGTLTGWIRYQFAAPVDVAQYTIQAHPTTPLRSPKDWALEYSDDGSAWVPVEMRSGVSSWTNGEIKSYTVVLSSATDVRVSQVAVEVLRTNTGAKARVSQLPVEVLRINTGTKIRASQLAVEVLRPNAAAASASARPVVFVAT